MTPEQQEGNKKIAEWMPKLSEDTYLHPQGNFGFKTLASALYHSDSNWQDSVLKKISELGYGWEIRSTLRFFAYVFDVEEELLPERVDIIDVSGEDKNDVVFNLLVKFIDWYNSKTS